jgi:hypothetical protein
MCNCSVTKCYDKSAKLKCSCSCHKSLGRIESELDAIERMQQNMQYFTKDTLPSNVVVVDFKAKRKAI